MAGSSVTNGASLLVLVSQQQEMAALEERCAALEKELRVRKRECEKLQALHFRLRNDLKVTGGDLRCVFWPLHPYVSFMSSPINRFHMYS